MNETYGKLNMEQGAQFVEKLQKVTFRHPEEMTKLQEEFEFYVIKCLDKELERLSLLHFYDTAHNNGLLVFSGVFSVAYCGCQNTWIES